MTSPQRVSGEDEGEYDFDRRQDDRAADEPDIRPAKGIAIGVLLSVPFWVGLFVWLFR